MAYQQTDKEKELLSEFYRILQAVQGGVGLLLNYDPSPGEPKHLRMGINSNLVQHGALVRLLIEKGFFTGEEYAAKLIEVALEERQRLTDEIQQKTGKTVELH